MAEVERRWLEYMRVADLPPALKNPKNHAVEVIAEGIGAHGYMVPMVLDERTGRLVAGHGRRAELLRLAAAGVDPPDGIAVDNDGMWLVPVTRGWSSVDDDQAHAAGVVLNQATIAGGMEREGLADLLEDLRERRQDGLLGTGFADDGLERLRSELGRSGLPLPEPAERKRRERLVNPVVCPACSHEFYPAPAK